MKQIPIAFKQIKQSETKKLFATFAVVSNVVS